jgi:predicted secreted hydrolase
MIGSQGHWRFHLFLSLVLCGGLSLFVAPHLTFCDGGESKPEEGFLKVNGPCHFLFPRDHGSHPGYRTEWWYYTGNVKASSGREFGFQLTLFRTQISPPGAERDWPKEPSAWRTQQLYLAHAALSDLEGKEFHHHEKMARGAVGLAGVEDSKGNTRVFLGTWAAEIAPDGHRLRADTDSFAIDVVCEPLKPVVAHGNGGYSLKGARPESASCYYSFTRLQVAGIVKLSRESFHVEGTAWMDHEFSTAPLEPGLVGWDWFSLQLSDDREIMLYQLRNQEGGRSPASSGTLVDSTGAAHHLDDKEFRVEVLDHWKSPHSGAFYPSRWRIEVLPANLTLEVVPNLADQELTTAGSTQVTYWEGSVFIRGRSGNEDVAGAGYVEMTGYAQPFNLPK